MVSLLSFLLQELNHKPRKQTEYGLPEIEDIIWEVDEDANGWIDWENFVQLYLRCRNDRSVRPRIHACKTECNGALTLTCCDDRGANQQDCSTWSSL